jgi:VanZ family protein
LYAKIFQAAAWLLTLTVVLLSFSPRSLRPTIVVAHDLEHIFIFLALGTAFGFGYPGRFRLLVIALLTFTTAIEIAQLFIPGRHARLNDFLVDAAAACFGIAVSWMFLKCRAAIVRE